MPKEGQGYCIAVARTNDDSNDFLGSTRRTCRSRPMPCVYTYKHRARVTNNFSHSCLLLFNKKRPKRQHDMSESLACATATTKLHYFRPGLTPPPRASHRQKWVRNGIAAQFSSSMANMAGAYPSIHFVLDVVGDPRCRLSFPPNRLRWRQPSPFLIVAPLSSSGRTRRDPWCGQTRKKEVGGKGGRLCQFKVGKRAGVCCGATAERLENLVDGLGVSKAEYTQKVAGPGCL